MGARSQVQFESFPSAISIRKNAGNFKTFFAGPIGFEPALLIYWPCRIVRQQAKIDQDPT